MGSCKNDKYKCFYFDSFGVKKEENIKKVLYMIKCYIKTYVYKILKIKNVEDFVLLFYIKFIILKGMKDLLKSFMMLKYI